MKEQSKRKFGFSNNQLKIIAMFSMLLDHIGVYLLPECASLRILGRLAFPIFAYMIAEGCLYTRNRAKYLALIAVLAAGCQLVYWVAMRSLYQSILVTFSLAIITIYAIDFFIKKKNTFSCVVATLTVLAVAFLVIIAPEIWKEQGFIIDYGVFGILLPVAVYYAPKRGWKLLAAAVSLVAMAAYNGGFAWYSLAALPFLLLYNGARGKYRLKYMFYIFYPTHLAVIYLIGLLLSAG